MGIMQILCSLGDDKIQWDPDNDKQVDFAEGEFDKLIAKGYKCFRMDDGGNKAGREVKSFPPHAGRLIFIPRVVGG